MATRTTRTLSVQLRLVATEEQFTDDEPPSLGAMPVVDTEGHTVSESIRPLAKAAAFPWLRAAGGTR